MENRRSLTSMLILSLAVATWMPTTPGFAAERMTFDQVFAPQDGMVASTEKESRFEMCLNGNWQFQAVAMPADFRRNVGNPPTLTAPVTDKWDAVPIRIPSPWNINAFPYGQSKNLGPGGDFRAFPSYPQAWDDVRMAWMRKTVKVPAEWKQGRRVILHFDAVNGHSQVIVNGKAVGENFDNFLPFEFDVTDLIRTDSENEILVGVRRAELFDNEGKVGRRPYVAGSMWAEDVAGIWQDVFLLSVPEVRVSEVLIRPEVDKDTLAADLVIKNDSQHEQRLTICGDVQPWVNLAGKDTLEAPVPKWKLDPTVLQLARNELVVPAGATAKVSVGAKVDGKLKLWSPDAPNLYGVTFEVRRGDTVVDRKYQRFGYRQLKLTKTDLELNGKPFKFQGDAWHFLGVPQMTRRYAWAWYEAVKASNCNAVRLHAQPYPKLYMDVADEMGIFVLDETGIWGSDASPKLDSEEYWKRSDDHVTRLVMRDRNHPSVMGWSVTNEVLVILRTRGASQEAMERTHNWYTAQVEKIKTLDPTREWVSGDGDDDVHGRLPVFIGHYGGFTEPANWAKKGKAWGVGECGMAYYGTPKQVSQYNGTLSYESMLGRHDGLAREAYKLIKETHRDLNASYSSVFNVVWYGLKPLPLGLKDVTKSPTIEDGVWFTRFAEGQPGMQPERLGPYCTTLNPGYDPKLPLYQTWPMFDAIKAANAPGAPASSEYDRVKVTPEEQAQGRGGRRRGGAENAAAVPPATKPVPVPLLGGQDESLKLELALLGVPIRDSADTSASNYVIISGQNPPDHATKAIVDQTLAAGGTVLVWRPKKEALQNLNVLLPQPLELNSRVSTSLLPMDPTSLTAGITGADFYFTELQPNVVLEGGLAGPLVESGKAVLKAPDVDWRRWNGQPEIVKTGAVARSEAEAQPSGVAVSATSIGNGRVIVANLGNLTVIPQRISSVRRLLANTGIALGPQRDLITGGLFTNAGALRKALVLGRFSTAVGNDADNAAAELSAAQQAAARPGTKVGNATWTIKEANPSMAFDFHGPEVNGPIDNTALYMSFWINSPRGLDDVLGEPDVPKLDLHLSGEGWEAGGLVLNGKSVERDRRGGNSRGNGAYPLNLKRGWNHVLIRTTHGVGAWEVRASVHSNNPDFLSRLEAAIEPPK